MIYIGEGVLHLADDVTVESGGEIPRDWADANKEALQSLTDRGLTDGKPSEKKDTDTGDKDEVKRLNSEIKRLESELKKSVDKKSDKIIKDLESEIEGLKSVESESQEKIKNLESEIEGLKSVESESQEKIKNLESEIEGLKQVISELENSEIGEDSLDDAEKPEEGK